MRPSNSINSLFYFDPGSFFQVQRRHTRTSFSTSNAPVSHPRKVKVGDTASATRVFTKGAVIDFQQHCLGGLMNSPCSFSSSLTTSSPYSCGGGESSSPDEMTSQLPVCSALIVGLISNVLGTDLPGPQSIFLKLDTCFELNEAEGAAVVEPPPTNGSVSMVTAESDTTTALTNPHPITGVFTGDIVTATVTVKEFIAKRGIVVLDAKVEVQRGGDGEDAPKNDRAPLLVATGSVVGVNKVITFEGTSTYTPSHNGAARTK